MQVHNRLAFDENGRPRLYVFSTCKQFIRTFPCLVYDSCDVEDVDTSGEDHIYDELRYVCMARPVKALKRSEPYSSPLVLDDPLNLNSPDGIGAYPARVRMRSR